MLSGTVCYSLDFQSSRTLSLAQSGRGGALLNDTITLNPALLSFQPITAFSGTFDWVPTTETQTETNHTYNASVIDGKNQYVNAGISFTRRPDLDFVDVSLAKRVLPWLGFGTLVKRFTTRSNTLSASGNGIGGFDGGVSAAIVPPPDFLPIPIQVGLTADNLRDSPNNEQYTGPRQFGGGIKATLKDMLMLYGDAVENRSNFMGSFAQYSAGTEISLGSDVFIRGGLLGWHQTGWSAGLGWVGPKIGLAYGYQNLHEGADRSFQHAITMDIFM